MSKPKSLSEMVDELHPRPAGHVAPKPLSNDEIWKGWEAAAQRMLDAKLPTFDAADAKKFAQLWAPLQEFFARRGLEVIEGTKSSEIAALPLDRPRRPL
jgi:hypothetical protein